MSILNFDFEGEEKTVVANLKAIVEKYANLDLGIDKEVFTALLKEYRSQVDSTYLPELYQTIATEYGGNERTYVDSLYARSELTTPRGLKRFLEQDTTYQIYNDPAINLGIDLITKLFERICRYSRLPVKSSGMNVCSTLPCDVCTHPVTSIPTPTPPCV